MRAGFAGSGAFSLPKSRINWQLLETAETPPIVYRNGDTITQAGVTLKMEDGVWVQLSKSAPDVRIEALMSRALNRQTRRVCFKTRLYRACKTALDILPVTVAGCVAPGQPPYSVLASRAPYATNWRLSSENTSPMCMSLVSEL